MKPIVIATGNPHKVDELRAIFAAAGLEVEGLTEASQAAGRPLTEPAETGGSFAENAAIKACGYAAQLGRTCLADDSGLEIDALSGRPGVISSHYCTDGLETGLGRAERDRLNNERVLRELEGIDEPRRTARFVCVMCVAAPGSLPHDLPRVAATCSGVFEGRIGLPGTVPRGAYGFGYDPLFLVGPEFRLTSAELPPEEKNRVSHRALAARHMAEAIRTLR